MVYALKCSSSERGHHIQYFLSAIPNWSSTNLTLTWRSCIFSISLSFKVWFYSISFVFMEISHKQTKLNSNILGKLLNALPLNYHPYQFWLKIIYWLKLLLLWKTYHIHYFLVLLLTPQESTCVYQLLVEPDTETKIFQIPCTSYHNAKITQSAQM